LAEHFFEKEIWFNFELHTSRIMTLARAMVKPQAPSKPFPNPPHCQEGLSPPVSLESQIHEPSKEMSTSMNVEQDTIFKTHDDIDIFLLQRRITFSGCWKLGSNWFVEQSTSAESFF
jgi:hypothetical protein